MGPGIDVISVMTSLAEHTVMGRRQYSYPITLNGEQHEPYGFKDPRRLAIVFFLTLEAENHGYESDGNTHHSDWERRASHGLVIIVTEHHQVFIGQHKDLSKRDRRISSMDLEMHFGNFEWKNTSNHDSCWRSDGFSLIHKIEADLYHKCFDHVPDEHRMPPIYVAQQPHFGDFALGPMYKFALVQTEKDPREDRNDGYWRVPTSIEFLDEVITLNSKKKKETTNG